MRIVLFHLITLSTIVGLLTGCGGGGGASSSSSTTTGDGYFVDSAVQGIEYTTNSTSGVTDSTGRFTYNLTDTTITFKLGDLTIANDFNLSNLNEDKKVLPPDLLGIDRNNTTDENLTKMLRVLQSLDNDGNPDNGIVIQTSTKNFLTTTANILDSNITELNTMIVNAGKTLKSSRDAKAHYEANLRDSFSINVDTIEPDTPTLTLMPTQTEQNLTSVEVNGEIGSKIFVNGIDTNFTIENNGKKTISLDTNATLGDSNTFIIVLIDDSNNQSTALDFNITKANLPPVFTSSNTVNVNENQTSALTFVATDLSSITYSISGGDSSSFNINSSSGLVTFKSAPDYEIKNSYTFTATASDGTNDTNQSVTININNVNDVTPVLSNFSSSVNENVSIGTAVGNITISSSGDSVITSFTLSNTTNFDINGSGYIVTNSALDYENTTEYNLTVYATNSAGNSLSKPVDILVNNLNDNGPVLTSSTSINVNENQTSALTLSATDIDNLGSLIYSVSSGDSGSFDVNSSTGVVTFKSAPDYETKSGYTFLATVSDGINEDSKIVTININDLDDDISTAEIFIKSAVYDNNRTATANDDILYLYFNKQIDSSSISVDMSINYDLNGTGAIGSASGSDYNDTIFHRQKISLNSSGTASTALDSNSTKISLASNVITDVNGSYPSDLNQTLVTEFNVFGRLKTGKTITYVEHDDGNTTRGIERSYTDNENGTVTDNVTGLMWQKEDDNNTKTWDSAVSYCENLTLGDNSDWRLPTIRELMSIVDRGETNPAINPVFVCNRSNPDYWYWSYSSKKDISSMAWRVSFYNGGGGANFKSISSWSYRCVRSLD